ncbi:MAG: cell division protein FtsN, partial [Enterobacter asburiae]|nr:cell division protein FtsN [Enterobacter asburiae]
AQPYQDLLQTPAHTTAQQPKTQQAAPVTKETEAPKQTAEKKDERRWMVQCGSFKGAEQAETVRAQLAFEGFDSRITTNNGWNRVVIGPVKGKENADGTISRLKIAGHTNCIRLASGG